MDIEVLFGLAGVAALVLTILAFIYIVPESKFSTLNDFGKFLHNTFNFKYLILEKILKAFYVFSTISVVCVGFFMLFYVDEGYYSDEYYGGYGILLMLLGPIAVRIAYEFLMMAILLVKNVIEINGKLKAAPIKNAVSVATPAPEAVPAPVVDEEATAPEAAPEAAPARGSFCSKCGSKVGDEMFCGNCGNKLR